MRALLTIAILATLVFSTPSEPKADDRPNKIKAAFIFNFARFTTWPEDSFVGPFDQLRICVHEGHHLVEPLREISGEMVGDRRIRLVTRPDAATPGTDCHIVVTRAGEDVVQTRGVLTVGDSSDVFENGGAVGLVQIGRQVRFQINQNSLRQSGLKMSSQLMRLAIRVVK